jgi:hypothetical protein
MLSLITFLNGCSTPRLPKYEAQPPSQYSYSYVKDGLVVAIHPLMSKQETEKYFGTDLLSANILAVLVVAENQNDSASFILSKDKVSLKAGEATAGSATGHRQVGDPSAGEALGAAANVGALAIVATALVSIPLGLLAGDMISDAGVIRRNFTTNELQTKTLSPGQKVQGFVYFQLPAKHNLLPQWAVHIEAVNLSNRGANTFDFAFAWERD